MDSRDKEIIIKVLKYIIENTDYLNNHDAAQGIAKKIIAEKSLEKLSPKQEEVYKNTIEPLFEPKCTGVMEWDDHDTCNGDGHVDIESLLISYEEDNMLCQHCRYKKQRIERE